MSVISISSIPFKNAYQTFMAFSWDVFSIIVYQPFTLTLYTLYQHLILCESYPFNSMPCLDFFLVYILHVTHGVIILDNNHHHIISGPP